MIAASEIEKLSLPDRLEMMELLWRSISRKPEDIDSPDWHGKILESRIAHTERGAAEFLTLEQLKKRLKPRNK